MTINTNRTRNGEIVSVAVVRALMETGKWSLLSAFQVIDGVSYWWVENDECADYCLVSIRACDAAGLAPE
jgi:hypothetical protein